MPKENRVRPRLIAILTVLLLLQSLLMLFLGLNLLTDRWAFLSSWSVFWAELQAAVLLAINIPWQFIEDKVLLYYVIAFVILVLASAAALIAGVTFYRGKAVTWILSLVAQIGTLISGLGLYFISRPPQSYWLLLVGVIMVLYLNYGEVRQWFLQSDEEAEEGVYV